MALGQVSTRRGGRIVRCGTLAIAKEAPVLDPAQRLVGGLSGKIGSRGTQLQSDLAAVQRELLGRLQQCATHACAPRRRDDEQVVQRVDRGHLNGAERRVQLAEADHALQAEKAKFEQMAKGIAESARRQALDEFLADLHVEERRYVREHRVLFAHRKSLVLQERIFFRNVPISNWVEHEVPVEEGADLENVAKTLRVFGALDAASSGGLRPDKLLFRAG